MLIYFTQPVKVVFRPFLIFTQFFIKKNVHDRIYILVLVYLTQNASTLASTFHTFSLFGSFMMNVYKRIIFPLLFLLSSHLFIQSVNASKSAPVSPLNPNAPARLPNSIEGRTLVPDFGCFWSFEPSNENPESWRPFVDAVAKANAFDALAITLRNQNYFADNPEAVKATQSAAQYALEKYGIKTLLDLDVRIARHDFEKIFPDLLQERLFFQEREKSDADLISFSFSAPILKDHYSGKTPYFVRGGRVLRAWAYALDDESQIIPETIQDVTDYAVWNDQRVYVTDEKTEDIDKTVVNALNVSFLKTNLPTGCDAVSVAVAFRYSYPDLFADETLELEKTIFEKYKETRALGGYKDEWGFPCNFERIDLLNDFWYSERMAQAYAKLFENRDLVTDLFLSFKPQKGAESERIHSIDRYRLLCAERVVEYENQLYLLNKQLWGADAFVGVHPTWYPWPNNLEMRKNGLMWWKAPRDVAQTDEYVPFCVRNSMAKGCNSLWINMFYNSQTLPYAYEHWTAAASGGRVHIHQIYPRTDQSPTNPEDNKLLPIVQDAKINQVREKVRMLTLVSDSQINSSVAVIFGRLGASNPLRPEYQAVGVDLCDRCALQGYPADLIPVDEIFSTRPNGELKWKIKNNRLAYGEQPYEVLILYGENDAETEAWQELRKTIDNIPNCKTRLLTLSGTASSQEKDAIIQEALETVQNAGVLQQTPWVNESVKFSSEISDEISARPALKSTSRFLDGSILWTAAEECVTGDPISLVNERVKLAGEKTSEPLTVTANGLFLARFDQQGNLNAIVATDVKKLDIGVFSFELSPEEIGDAAIDISLWKGSDNQWRGVFQRKRNDLPSSLMNLVPTWNYLQKL